MLIQVDGRVIVATEGTGLQYAAGNAALLRFLPDGRSDLTFGTAGIKPIPTTTARLLAITPDGKLLLSDMFPTPTLARLTLGPATLVEFHYAHLDH